MKLNAKARALSKDTNTYTDRPAFTIAMFCTTMAANMLSSKMYSVKIRE